MTPFADESRQRAFFTLQESPSNLFHDNKISRPERGVQTCCRNQDCRAVYPESCCGRAEQSRARKREALGKKTAQGARYRNRKERKK